MSTTVKYHRLHTIEAYDLVQINPADRMRFEKEIESYRPVMETLSADTHVSKMHFCHPVLDRFSDHDGIIVSARTEYRFEIKTRNKKEHDYKECYLDPGKVEQLSGQSALHIAYVVPLKQLFIWRIEDHAGKQRRTLRRGPEDVYVYLRERAQIINVRE